MALFFNKSAKELSEKEYQKGVSELEAGAYRRAFRHFSDAAEAENDKAMLALGTMYYKGLVLDPVEDETAEAEKWWKRSASLGNAAAKVNLSMLYAYGKVKYRNYSLAREYMEEALASGEPGVREKLENMDQTAALQLTKAVKYYSEKHVEESKLSMKDAMDLGSESTMFLCADMIDANMLESDEPSLTYYEKAAEKGSADGAFRAAVRTDDAQKTIAYYNLAYERRSAELMEYLEGLTYHDGEGTVKAVDDSTNRVLLSTPEKKKLLVHAENISDIHVGDRVVYEISDEDHVCFGCREIRHVNQKEEA